MAGNVSQGGPSFRGRRPDLWYFDRLPPTARKALAEAVFDWSSGWLYGLWNRGKLRTGAEIAARVDEADRQQITKDQHRVWRLDK